jgi:pilus assembly protein CpaF
MVPTRSARDAMPDADLADIVISDRYQETKHRVFNLVLERLEAKQVGAEIMRRSALQEEIARALGEVDVAQAIQLNSIERGRLVEDVLSEILGLGPLEPLLGDETVDDIIVNGPHTLYVERGGRLSQVKSRFRDAAHLMNIIQRIVSPIGRRVDEACPFVDARLRDGSRVNIIIPPLALDGPLVSIRKLRRTALGEADLLRNHSLDAAMLDFLARAVRARLNILVCGGTGSGKTTFLNILSGFIDKAERLVTIEDAAELRLHQPHVARLESRPPNAEGSREITARDLMRNALRMRPDRIILGEVRGAEAVDMLQAMSTGHDGSMATMHANGTRDALDRLEMLLGIGGLGADIQSIRRYIARSLQLLVQVQRMSEGRRRVVSIAELAGLAGDDYRLCELFRFVEEAGPDGAGDFVRVAARSSFEQRLLATVPR